jgi:hypothetical protein|nr:MAG TPA: hypothetical protein [Bacteriophage sp.]
MRKTYYLIKRQRGERNDFSLGIVETKEEAEKVKSGLEKDKEEGESYYIERVEVTEKGRIAVVEKEW